MSLEIKIKNFRQKELKCSCCGVFAMEDYHINNLQALRFAYNEAIVVNSGCRCEKRNMQVKGSKNSRHLFNSIKKSDATDIRPKLSDNKELFINELQKLFELAKSMRLFKEIILHINIKNIDGSFIHVASYPYKGYFYESVKLDS